MKRWLLLAALAAVVALPAAWLALRPTPRPALPLDIFFTCDVHGRLVPCGCFSGQMGGLTRIASLLGRNPPETTLEVDVGNAIEDTADYQLIEQQYILRAFHEMGYEAANLGHAEAQLSATQLRALKAQSPVPLLSANLLDRQTGAAIFDGYRIVQRGAWRIALVGVMDEHLPAETLGEGLAIEPMETTLSRLLPTLRKKSDFIVLLAFADEARLHQLARSFYEIQIILGGKVSQPAQRLEQENRSLILYTTNESRALGSLRVHLNSPGKLSSESGEVTLVDDRIPEDPAIRKLAVAYRDEVRHTRLEIDDPAHLQKDRVPGVKSTARYAGSESCLLCHATAGKIWQNTGHAHAFGALLTAGADADPNCIGCHTVGFGAPGGYHRDFGAADGTPPHDAGIDRFAAVGCESCHGPGGQHAAQHQAGGEITAHFRPLGAGDCQKCHHGEFSRPFAWDAFWPKIAHSLEPIH